MDLKTDTFAPAQLAPRFVYPVKLCICAEGLPEDGGTTEAYCTVTLQHDELGSELLSERRETYRAAGTSPIFCGLDDPFLFWVGDGMIATIADASCIISLMRAPRPVQPAPPDPPAAHSPQGWLSWLGCFRKEHTDGMPPQMVMQASSGLPGNEVCQVVVPLQDVLLTARMAHESSFPIPGPYGGGTLTIAAAIGQPQRGRCHLAIRHDATGTLVLDHNEDTVFVVEPIAPVMSRNPSLLPSPSLPATMADRKPLLLHMDSLTSPFTPPGQTGNNLRHGQSFAASPSPRVGLTPRLSALSACKTLGDSPDLQALSPHGIRSTLSHKTDSPRSSRSGSERHVSISEAQRSVGDAQQHPSRVRALARATSSMKRSYSQLTSQTRASPVAKMLATGAPVLEFEVRQATNSGRGEVVARCLHGPDALEIRVLCSDGSFETWAFLHYSQGVSGDVGMAVKLQMCTSGSTQQLCGDGSTQLAPVSCSFEHLGKYAADRDPTALRRWRLGTVEQPGGASPGSMPSGCSTQSRPVGHAHPASSSPEQARQQPDTHAAAQVASERPGLATSTPLVDDAHALADLGMWPVLSGLMHHKRGISWAADPLLGSRPGSRAGSRTGSRPGSRSGSRPISRQASYGNPNGNPSRPVLGPSNSGRALRTSLERMRNTGSFDSKRRSYSDAISEPCELALELAQGQEAQAAALVCLAYALYALTSASMRPAQRTLVATLSKTFGDMGLDKASSPKSLDLPRSRTHFPDHSSLEPKSPNRTISLPPDWLKAPNPFAANPFATPKPWRITRDRELPGLISSAIQEDAPASPGSRPVSPAAPAAPAVA